MSRLAAKVNALEAAASASTFSSAAVRLVKSGRCYDELNDSEKTAYNTYWGVSRKALEDCNTAVLGTLHFALHEKANDELQAAICKVERLVSRKSNE